MTFVTKIATLQYFEANYNYDYFMLNYSLGFDNIHTKFQLNFNKIVVMVATYLILYFSKF